MAKVKTTSKAIKQAYALNFIWRTGYCSLQNLLTGLNPKAYTSGIYGWNFDLYEVKGVAITTGYRGMIGRVIPNDLVDKYEKLASEIKAKSYEERMQQLEQMRKNFIEELYK